MPSVSVSVGVGVAPSRGSRAGIEEVVGVMSADLDAIARQLTDAIHAHLGELDDDLRVATLQSTRANVGMIMAMLREGTEPAQAAAPAEALAYVRDYVRRGLGIELLQRAYRTAQADFSRMWLEQLRARAGDAEDLAEAFGFFNNWLFAWVETIERQLTAVYMDERERWVRGAAALRAEEVRAILEGARVDVRRASSVLRYELEREHVAYVVSVGGARAGERDVPDVFGAMEQLAAAVADAMGARDHLAVAVGRHLACWAGFREPAHLGDLAMRLGGAAGPTGLSVAVGQPGRGVEGFRRSHREAMLTRGVARLARRAPGACVAFADVALDALLVADPDEARRFVARELGALGEDTDAARRQRATLLVFLEENHSFLHAARRLGVHENTVAYRVRRCEELLGRRIAERELELRVALRLARLAL